jgi:ubiquinone/menaquinone biosynthesis C-methylase UbiE
VKLDLGCGPNPPDGFDGVDVIPFDTGKVKHVVDLRKTPWPFYDNSVDEARSSHFIEHLTAVERVGFFNELHRILKPGGTCLLIVPHWCSSRAYGDPTHQWPPVSEMAWFYLNKKWRLEQAPHTDKKHWPEGYDCDFDFAGSYNLNPVLSPRNPEYQQFAISWYKESAFDIVCTLTKRKGD